MDKLCLIKGNRSGNVNTSGGKKAFVTSVMRATAKKNA